MTVKRIIYRLISKGAIVIFDCEVSTSHPPCVECIVIKWPKIDKNGLFTLYINGPDMGFVGWLDLTVIFRLSSSFFNRCFQLAME